METAAAPAEGYRLHPVSVPGFSGPLDLLLSVIEEGKFDISALSLTSVINQYLVRLRALGDLPPDHLADFLVVAATLLLLKSKTLFPELPLSEEEENRITRLEEQLREYRRFREAAKTFIALWNAGRTAFARESLRGFEVTFYPPPEVDSDSLRGAMARVIEQLPSLDMLAEDVLRRVVSIEERIRDIQQRLTDQARTTFQTLASSAASKLEVIVSFLALLELVKQRIVAAEQPGTFQDILVEPRNTDAAA